MVGSGASIAQAYAERFAGSRALWERARKVSPSGIHHDGRRILPFPVYVERASGCRKWDVDGGSILDFAAGHGALILGHGHPEIQRAVVEQVSRVTHASAPTPLEVEWAERIVHLVPCADMVRFLMSGTEATLLAMRLARAHTKRDVIVKFQGHFHGWHDYALLGYLPPFDVPMSSGIPRATSAAIRSLPLHDLAALEQALKAGDVAGVILEPDGPLGGTVPVQPGFLQAARELTRRYESLLIFDEVVTGFRMSPGGAQQYFQVTPDLATYAKAVCGGVPGAAVAGAENVMSDMAFRDDAEWNRSGRVRHQGTFSANPLTAAAGVVATTLLADGSVQDHCANMADRLRAGMNRELTSAGVGGCIYGVRSSVRVVLGDDLPCGLDAAEFTATVPPLRLIEGTRQPLLGAVQCAMLLEGLDILGGAHAWTSLPMTEADIDEAIGCFSRAVARVVREGHLPRRRAPN